MPPARTPWTAWPAPSQTAGHWWMAAEVLARGPRQASRRVKQSAPRAAVASRAGPACMAAGVPAHEAGRGGGDAGGGRADGRSCPWESGHVGARDRWTVRHLTQPIAGVHGAAPSHSRANCRRRRASALVAGSINAPARVEGRSPSFCFAAIAGPSYQMTPRMDACGAWQQYVSECRLPRYVGVRSTWLPVEALLALPSWTAPVWHM